MRLAIMQPYFLPYIGYFQLMAAADKIILLDDVNFIKRGWINRNRIVVHGQPRWLTLPLAKASQNRLISEIEIVDDPVWRRKALRQVELGYGLAPFASRILPLFHGMLSEARGPLSGFLFRLLRQVAGYIGIRTIIEPTSAIYPKQRRTGQDRILDICAQEGATSYLNLPGGRSLYDAELFAAAGIELRFLDPNLEKLALRYSGTQGPIFSILDLLMLNPVTAIHEATRAASLEPAQ
jgi:hypothetical protein